MLRSLGSLWGLYDDDDDDEVLMYAGGLRPKAEGGWLRTPVANYSTNT